MRHLFAKLSSVLIIASLAATMALASPDKQKLPKVPKMPVCPVCKMSLTMKKDKAHMKAVKMHGKTYYCCAACKMDKGAKTTKKK